MAQSTRFGVLPIINFNKTLNNRIDINTRYESRHFLFENPATKEHNFDYRYSLSDFSALIGVKTGFNSKINAGFLTRFLPNTTTYRSIQQFILKDKISKYRVAHRLVTDQTFNANEAPEFRLRYRFNGEIPLAGEKVDPKEFYLKVNTEILNSLQANTYDLEFRIIPNIGFVINKNQKIEVGFDNRFISFIYNKTRITSWVTISWFL